MIFWSLPSRDLPICGNTKNMLNMAERRSRGEKTDRPASDCLNQVRMLEARPREIRRRGGYLLSKTIESQPIGTHIPSILNCSAGPPTTPDVSRNSPRGTAPPRCFWRSRDG